MTGPTELQADGKTPAEACEILAATPAFANDPAALVQACSTRAAQAMADGFHGQALWFTETGLRLVKAARTTSEHVKVGTTLMELAYRFGVRV